MSWASDWLDSHAIDRELARELLGYQDDCLLFYYEGPDGDSYARRRTADGKMLQPKGMPLSCYWPLGQADGAWVLLCEGEGDALAAASILDKTDHVALNGLCPVGLPGTGAWKRAVEELVDARVSRCYVCLDADDAGRGATAKLVPALTEAGIEVCPIELPEGYDLADLLAGVTVGPEQALATLVADTDPVHAVSDMRRRLAA